MELFNVGGMCPETNYIFMGKSVYVYRGKGSAVRGFGAA
jgi:hypothetical protein